MTGFLLPDEEGRLRTNALTPAPSIPEPSSGFLLPGEQSAGERASTTLRSAIKVNPDKAAEARRLAGLTDTPEPVVARNLDATKSEARLREIQQAMRFDPVLARQLTDPAFAKLAHDDVETLAGAGSIVRGPANKAILRSSEFATLVQEIKKNHPGMTWDDARFAAAQRAEVNNTDDLAGPIKAPPATFATIATGLAKSLPQGLEKVRQGIRAQFADLIGSESMLADSLQQRGRTEFDQSLSTPDIQSPTGKGLYSGGVSLLQQTPALLASLLTGNPLPALASAGLMTEAEAYGKYRGRGATAGEALMGAVGEGTTEVLTEALPMGFLVNKFGKAGVGEFLTGLLAREIPGEQIATIVQDAIDTAVANPDKTWGEYLKERPGAAYETLVATVTQAGAMGAIHKATERLALPQRQAETAERDAAALAKLADLAKASKLAQRDPQSFEQYVNEAAAEGPVQEVFINAAVFAQSMGENLPAVIAASPAVAEQLNEALAGNSDLVIPVGEYAAYIAPNGDALLPHLRTSADAMSQDEAKVFMQGKAEQFKAEAQKIMDEHEFTSAVKESAATVERELLTQLQEANRFTDDVNGAYAKLMGSFYAVQATRLGITPEEMYVRYPLRIQASGVVGDRTLDQKKENTPPATSAGGKASVGASRSEIRERPAVRAEASGSPAEPAQEKAAAGRGTDSATKLAATQAALKAGNDELRRQSESDIEEEMRSIERGGNGADLSALTQNPEFWDAEAEEFTEAGLGEVDRLNRALAEERVGNQPVTDLDRLNGKNHQAQADAFIAYVDGIGLFAKPVYSYGGSRYVELTIGDNGYKIRFANHANTVRDSSMQPDFNVAPGASDFTDVIDFVEDLISAQQQASASIPSDKDRRFTDQSGALPAAITIDGKERPTVNSNGQPIAQTEAGVRAFWKWFGDSKVVDDQGRPLVAYHAAVVSGDDSGISVFRDGTHFGTKEQAAVAQVESWRRQKKNGVDLFKSTYPVYLSLKNPKRMKDIETGWGAVIPKLIDQGYDGIVYKNEYEGGGDSFIAFKPEQIKSAVGNRGTFDAGSANILEQPAYHGSPHDFDTFSTDKIGTGEGAQAYGWGLYFAENPAVAAGYRQKLSPQTDARLVGSPEDISKKYKVDAFHLRNVVTLAAKETQSATKESLIRWLEKENSQTRKAAIKALRAGDVTVELSGVLYQVDIPDAAVARMLDWDKRLREQAPEVQEALLADPGLQGLITEQGNLYVDEGRNGFIVRASYDDGEVAFFNDRDGAEAYARAPDMSGSSFYNALSADRGQEAASRYLNSIGIPGIKYFDAGSRNQSQKWVAKHPQGGENAFNTEAEAQAFIARNSEFSLVAPDQTRNIVVFDNKIIQLTHKDGTPVTPKERAEFMQQSAGTNARGQISFGADITETPSVLTLLKNADLTTFLHEMGHFQLQVLADIASQPDAPTEIVADMDALLKWFGVPDLATWQGMTIDQQRTHHEKFARGFEAYLFEGRAPNVELNGIFARFRAWMLNVYRQLTSLNVTLTDEVRSVMDRMLATNEEIVAAEAARSYAPLFKSAEDAGMTAAEWAAYQALGQDATQEAVDQLQTRSLRDMKYAANARSRVIRELQKDAAAKRREVRIEARREILSEPVYQAWQFLTRRLGPEDKLPPSAPSQQTRPGDQVPNPAGLLAGRLDVAGLRDIGLPQEIIDHLVNLRMTAKEGLHPDIVADLMGFTSGDELARSLAAAEQPAAVIEALTDQRMLERYGDLADQRGIERAANEAIHNEVRGRFIATELRALDKAMNVRKQTPAGGSFNILAKAAKEFAAQIVARKRVRDLRPAQYAAAEARAARGAETAKSLVEKATEKRNQLVNHYATAAAYDAVSEVEKGVRYLKKFDNEGTRKNLEIGYRDQIDAMLERFDLRQITNRDADKRAALADWIKAQEDQGLEPAISDDLRNEAFRKPYRELTVEEFRGLVDAVKNIEHLARLKHKLMTLKDKREFEAVVGDLARGITDNAKGTIAERRTSDRGVMVSAGRLFRNFFADHRKFASLAREMDGWQDDGTVWNTLVRNMNDAGNFEAVEREKATIKLTELMAPLFKGEKLGAKRYFPTIGKSFTREERLGMALNMGNETNRERVLTGERLTPQQLQTVLDTLEKSDWDFVQGVWDYLESFRPQIAAKERRLTGLEPEWVEASPVMTKHGIYKGGYYPIKADPLRSTRGEADTAAEVQRQMERGLYVRAQTRRGHLKARSESTGRAIRYDLAVIVEHVDQVVHDLAWHEYLIDANRLMRAGAVDAAIRNHYGPEKLRTMTNLLTDIAVGDMGAQSAGDRILNHLRQGATIAGLGWRVTTSLLQPIGLTQSMVRIGPKWVAKGAVHWLGDATKLQNSVRLVGEKSDFMRLRAKTMQREINEIRNKVAGEDSRIEATYFYLIQKMQLVADIPTWWGAYEKAMAADGMTEAKAVALADQAVIDAQGAGQTKDLAAVQRGSPAWKLFTNFYSFFSTTYNLTTESVGRTNFKSPASVGLLATDLLLLYTIPAILGTLMKATLGGDWDDEEKLLKQLIADQMSYLLGTVVGLRELGGGVQAALGLPGGYSGPAGVRFFGEVTKLAKQASQGEADAAFWKALNSAAGVLFHYPAGQINATLEGAAALADGDTENPGALIVGPPR